MDKKRISILSALVLIGVLGAASYLVRSNTVARADDGSADAADTEAAESEAAEDEKTPIPVRTAAVARGEVSAYISATTNLVAENEVRVIAEWEGRLADLKVEEGQQVGRGQVLAVLAQTDARIARETAEARAADAAQRHARMKRLADQELISHEEYEKARLEDQVAAQELAEADWRLEKTLIRAPFAGRLTERMVQVGQHVRPGDELFTVTDFDPLVARIFLPERDVLSLDEGRAVRLTLKADETIGFAGTIRRISPVVDTATGTVKVTIEASRPPAQVRPGAFVRVDVVRETRPGALLVPREAIVRELQKAYVYVAENGVAKKRAIALGIEEDENIEALEGVAAGERVIVAGQGGLEDGAPVELLDADTDGDAEDDAADEARVAAL